MTRILVIMSFLLLSLVACGTTNFYTKDTNPSVHLVGVGAQNITATRPTQDGHGGISNGTPILFLKVSNPYFVQTKVTIVCHIKNMPQQSRVVNTLTIPARTDVSLSFPVYTIGMEDEEQEYVCSADNNFVVTLTQM